VILKLHALVATFRVAISSRYRVSFEYDGRTRTVEPYALGMWRNHWYLAGGDATTSHFRRFRLDRIESPAIAVDTASTFAIPADFDPDTAFALDPNERVDNDGTIHLGDGTVLGNHDPEGLRNLLEIRGNDVFVASHGVMRIPHETGSFMVCVSPNSDPCDDH